MHLRGAISRRIPEDSAVFLVPRDRELTPGCDRPTGISARLGGAEWGESLLDKLGDVEVGNQAVWSKYVHWRGSMVGLARWGHQEEGMPWEEVGKLVRV